MKHKKLETTPEISKRMSHVRLKRGKAEVALARSLWRNGVHYRYNYKKLPGSPDIAITRYKIAIFIDGEFWHGYDWENRKQRLQRNRGYWIEKIEENMARDARNDARLEDMGWKVIHFWEKEVKKGLEACVETVFTILKEQIIATK
ncbi:very short patch repair endonuclease [uncultured Desulfovibrio sp.]|uniref:very short patch repair endonuclease n=1 Tax=uncultured Desulfovibrio sp. TaxID=167968 RepID=UPI00265C8D92|nr:very short patch repair endonuclease [uncultured Desulfovibrio sp.]